MINDRIDLCYIGEEIVDLVLTGIFDQVSQEHEWNARHLSFNPPSH